MIALRSHFYDAGGNAPQFHGMPFIYLGRTTAHKNLYTIDVWLGDRFRTALAWADEIFYQAKELPAA